MKTKIFIFLFALLLICCNRNFDKSNNINVKSELIIEGKIHGLKVFLYTMEMPDDTICFARYGEDKKKPVALFIEGSGVSPLFIAYPDDTVTVDYAVFDSVMLTNYNLIMISKPEIPAIVNHKNMIIENDEHLGYRSDYMCNDEHYERYLQRDSLGTYVERANKVIEYISKQDWAKDENIYLFGHSQGAWIAAKIAEQNQLITGLGFSDANPDGRIAGWICEEQFYFQKNEQDRETTNRNIKNFLHWWNLACKNDFPSNIPRKPHQDTSYSISFVDILSHLTIPVFIAYGTEDGKCALRLEQMPIYFMQQGKTNYKMYPVEGCGHNFEPILDNKKHDFENAKWGDVFNEFSKFMEEQVK